MLIIAILFSIQTPPSYSSIEQVLLDWDNASTTFEFFHNEEKRIEKTVKAKFKKGDDGAYTIEGELDATLIPWQNTLPLGLDFQEDNKEALLRYGFAEKDWPIIQKYRDLVFYQTLYQISYDKHLTNALLATDFRPFIEKSALTMDWQKILNSEIGNKLMTDDKTTKHYLVLQNIVIADTQLSLLSDFFSKMTTRSQRALIRYILEKRNTGTTTRTQFGEVTQYEIHRFQNGIKALKEKKQ